MTIIALRVNYGYNGQWMMSCYQNLRQKNCRKNMVEKELRKARYKIATAAIGLQIVIYNDHTMASELTNDLGQANL